MFGGANKTQVDLGLNLSISSLVQSPFQCFTKSSTNDLYYLIPCIDLLNGCSQQCLKSISVASIVCFRTRGHRYIWQQKAAVWNASQSCSL